MYTVSPPAKLDKHSRDVLLTQQQDQIEFNRSNRLQQVNTITNIT